MMHPVWFNRAGQDSTDSSCASIDRSFEPPHTPTSGSDDEQPQFGHAGHVDSDDDVVSRDDAGPRRKPGGYDSRIEQILYENPDLPIVITDAGKSLESGGRYIVYTIKTGVWPSTSSLRLVLTWKERI